MLMTVSEHRNLPTDGNGNPLAIRSKPIAAKSYTPSSASARIDAVDLNTRFVCIVSDVDLHIGYGAVATNNDQLMLAGENWFSVRDATDGRLSFITKA